MKNHILIRKQEAGCTYSDLNADHIDPAQEKEYAAIKDEMAALDDLVNTMGVSFEHADLEFDNTQILHLRMYMNYKQTDDFTESYLNEHFLDCWIIFSYKDNGVNGNITVNLSEPLLKILDKKKGFSLDGFVNDICKIFEALYRKEYNYGK